MRRFLAFTLSLLFSWMLVFSIFVPGENVPVPACCRKGGKHQCAMRSEAGAKTSSLFSNSRCPYGAQGGVSFSHFDGFAPGPGAAIYAGLAAHPALAAQTEAGYRLTSLRVRQKRGPPFSLQS